MSFYKYWIFSSLLLLVACGGSTGTNTPDTNVDNNKIKLLPPAGNQIYFGAFPDFGGTENQVSQARIKAFEEIVKKKIGWAYFSENWYNGIIYPRESIHAIHDTGTVPFVRLMPRSDEIQGRPEPKFTMQNIINGVFDEELKLWAQNAIADNIPLLVDFAVEANGNWFQWSGIFNGGAKTDGYGDPNYPDGPERYRDAYRHIIDLFRSEGVKHITWFFHYNYLTYPDADWNKPKNYYPGDDYIDWVGISLYGAEEITEEWEGLQFSKQLKMAVDDSKAVTDQRPLALLEFGVTDNHPVGNKAEWLNDAFKTILNNPDINFKAISLWHENWQNEDESYSTIRLDSSPEAQATARRWLKDQRFISDFRFSQ